MKIITFSKFLEYNTYIMFQEKFTVLSTDIDHNQEIRLSSLLRYMQDVATHHATKIKVGHEVLSLDRNIWVIVRMEMKIIRLPKLDEDFYVSTHPGESTPMLFPRYFEVYDKHKKLLVTVSSTWVVINYDTRRIVLKPFKDRVLPAESDKDDIPLPEKITGEANELVDNRRARYSEVDMNGHINNTHYIDYILDTHLSSYYNDYKVTNLIINFDKEIKDGDHIDIYSDKNNPEIIIGKVDGHNSFVSKILFEKR